MTRTAFQPVDWSEAAQATDGAATATHTGESGMSHYVTLVTASFTGGADTGDLTITDGEEDLVTFSVHGDTVIPFASPLKITPGADVTAEIAGGGGGVVGNVTVMGFTLED